AALRDPRQVTNPVVTSVSADANGRIVYRGFQSSLMQGLPFSVTAEDGLSQGQNYFDPLLDATAIVVNSVTPSTPITGQATSIKATVTDTTAPATTVNAGTVTFSIDGTPVSFNVAVGPDGTATLVQNPGVLAAGPHNVTAAYNGNGFANSNTTSGFDLNVTAAPTQLTLSGNPTAPYGTAIVVGATISIPAPGNLINAALDGGTIQF